jgi:hypothetical protein
MHYIGSAFGTGGAGSFHFASIPQNFTHLQMRIVARDAASSGTGNTMYSYFNGVATGSAYLTHTLFGNGTTAQATYGLSRPYMELPHVLPGTTAGANIHGSMIIDLLDYRNTSKFKTIKMLSVNDQNNSGWVSFTGAAYSSYDPVTMWTITPGFSTTSRCDLYGITSNPLATGI